MNQGRPRIDPRIAAAGLLTGAVVAAWASRRAQEMTRDGVTERVIDWERARSIAVSMNREASLPAVERERLDREYAALVRRTIPLIADFTGVSLPRPLERVYAFDRVDWINANITAFQQMFAPIEKLEIFKRPDSPRAVNVLWQGLNQTVVSAELGVLLGYLARRVLGQYDLALLGREPLAESGKLYFVQPNIRMVERTLGVPPDQFRLWLALHETTHAFEFEAWPWVRQHMNAMIEEYFTFLTEDIEFLKRGLSGVRALVDRARNDEDRGGSWIEAVMSPEQRRLFGRMQATMAVIEGYSNYIMNAVGRDLMPDYTLVATRFERRQREKSSAEKLFIRLTGLDLKLEQYRLGEAFITDVERARGRAFVQRLWEGPDLLPSLAELRDPQSWITRVDRGANGSASTA